MLYTRTVMARFQNPKNSGGMHGANAIGQVGSEGSDLIKMYLKINDDGVIEAARFKSCGCCVAIAASDVMCDFIVGKTIDEALKVSNAEMLDKLGNLPPQKIHCTILAEEAVRAAVEDYYKRKEKELKKSSKKAKKAAKNAAADDDEDSDEDE